MSSSFQELDVRNIRGNTIFLDVDGTIVEDGGVDIRSIVRGKIDELKKDNTLYLCTNKKGMRERNKKIALLTGVTWIDSPCRKPSAKIISYIENPQNKPYLVIGDKYITDGLFAWRIGGQFIKTKRIVSSRDGFFERAVYMADNLVAAGMHAIRNVSCGLEAMRIHQWIKNLLIFTPIFFAGELFDGMNFFTVLSAFAVFCLAASFVYILNDISDRKNDVNHPIKKMRAIASGRLKIYQAFIMLLMLLGVAVFVIYFYVPQIFLPIIAYFILNLGYSFYLKHIPVFDIMTVSSFYLLRVLAGGMAAGTYMSRWLILCTIFITLFIITGKRKAELGRTNTREVLKKYNINLLDHLLTISLTATLVVYGVYTVLGVDSDIAVYSIIFVLVGMFRYVYLTYTSSETEFPERAVYRDKVVLASVVGWVGFMYYIFYG